MKKTLLLLASAVGLMTASVSAQVIPDGDLLLQRKSADGPNEFIHITPAEGGLKYNPAGGGTFSFSATAWSDIVSKPTTVSGFGITDAALNTRTISAGGLATGGGDLSANRTITVTAASQAEAEAGSATTVVMTPQRTAQAITALGGSGSSVPAGTVTSFAGRAAPTGWLFCYGQAVSRATYANLFSALVSRSTVTITIASPGVISWTNHGLNIGDPVKFSTTGTLPTGISPAGGYYVIAAGFTANSFRISGTRTGSAINTTGSQSGVHTCESGPYGIGDGSTTFNVPDLRGRVGAGNDSMGGTSADRLTGASQPLNGDWLGFAAGDETNTIDSGNLPAIPSRSVTAFTGSISSSPGTTALQGVGDSPDSIVTVDIGGGGAAPLTNLQPTIILNYIIKL